MKILFQTPASLWNNFRPALSCHKVLLNGQKWQNFHFWVNFAFNAACTLYDIHIFTTQTFTLVCHFFPDPLAASGHSLQHMYMHTLTLWNLMLYDRHSRISSPDPISHQLPSIISHLSSYRQFKQIFHKCVAVYTCLSAALLVSLFLI